MRSVVLVSFLLWFVTPSSPSQAASPRDELLQMVPEDVGFCLIVQQAQIHHHQLRDSPFAARFRDSVLLKRLLASEEWRQFHQSLQHFEKHLGVSAQQLLDDVLGEAVVFAYRPGPPDRPEQEQGLFLVRAREEKTLQLLIRRFNQLQQQSGDLKSLEECEHRGVKYLRRTEVNAVNYYHLHGPILLFSGQETLLKQALERLKQPENHSALLRQVRDLKLDSAVLGLYVNPRAWDAEIATNRSADPAAQMAARFWKAIQGIGLGLVIDDKVHLRLSLRVKDGELPEPARRFFSQASKLNTLWAQLPEQPLLALALRCDLTAMYELIASSLTAQARQAFDAELDRTLGAVLGVDVVKELLPAIGPDWAFWITAPATDTKRWLPTCYAALRVVRDPPQRPGTNPNEESIGESLVSLLTTAARTIILTHNNQHPDQPARLVWTNWQGKRFRSIRGGILLPEGVEPTFGLLDDYLIVSSYPEAWPRPRKPIEFSSIPLLRASLKSWRGFLQTHREPLAQFLSEKNRLSREATLSKIDDLLMLVELFDLLELNQQSASAKADLTLTLTPTASLRPTPRGAPGSR